MKVVPPESLLDISYCATSCFSFSKYLEYNNYNCNIAIIYIAIIEERPILIALRLFLKFLNRNSSILLFMLRYIHHSIQFWMQIPVIYFL